MENEIIYYSDELNDDFADMNIQLEKLPQDYEYEYKSPLKKVRKFLVYRCLVTPLTWVYNKLIKHIT
jgi:hypothetical protein